MFTQVSIAALFAGLAAAYHAPTEKGGNAITAPLLEVSNCCYYHHRTFCRAFDCDFLRDIPRDIPRDIHPAFPLKPPR